MTESKAPRPIGYRGCVLLPIPFVVLFVIHGLFIYAQASINQAKWLEKGSPNYTITTLRISLLHVGGTLRVRNGAVVDADPPMVGDPKYYQQLTVDGMFQQIRSYAFVPFAWESVDYHPILGYPTRVRFNTWSLATDPDIGIDVYELMLDPNPRAW